MLTVAPPDVICLITGIPYLYARYPIMIMPIITIIAVNGPLDLSELGGLFTMVAIFHSPP
jgi:hypothetical protein